jgi:hypothetical protein
MNNPFANFDLEESLSGLPGVLRQPMVLAVAASGLVHGLFFVVLPVVTNSAESKKLPDRIVNVIELTPEQQANLPPSMMVNQLPLNQTPLLPTAPGGKLPLTSLFPGMTPNSTMNIPKSKNPIDAYIEDSLRNSQNTIAANPYFDPLPPVRIRSGVTTPPVKEKTEAEKQAEAAAEKAKIDLAVQQRIEADEAKRKAEAEAKNNTPPGSQTTVEPNQPPGSTPQPPGAKDLKPSPEAVAKQQLIAATTYKGAGTTSDQTTQQDAATLNVQSQFAQQLAQEQPNLSPQQREEIAGSLALGAMDMSPTIALEPIAPQLPPGVTLEFGDMARPKELAVAVLAYVTPDGQLLSYSIVEGQPEALVVTRSSGFAYLDNQAREAIKAVIKQQPPKGEGYRSLKYQVPFKLPQQVPA